MPGGLGLYVPGFTLMGMSGHADVALATTSGHVSASLRGPFSPASAQCLTIGSSTDYLTMELDYAVSSLEFNLDLAAHVAWGDVLVEASLSLHTQPNPRFALSLALFVPLTDQCNLDFVLEAEASASLGGSGPLGIAGSFSFGNTRFNTDVFSCLLDAIAPGIAATWDTLIGDWSDAAGALIADLNNAINAETARNYNNPYGQCHKTAGMVQTLCSDNGDCMSNEEIPNTFGSYGCGNDRNGHGAHCECDQEGCRSCRCVADSAADISAFVLTLPDAPNPGDPHRFDPAGMSRNCDPVGSAVANGLSDAAQGTVEGANIVAGGVVTGANAVAGGVSDGANAVAGGVSDLGSALGFGRRLDEGVGGSAFPQIAASTARLRALMARQDVKYALELARDFPTKTSALVMKYKEKQKAEGKEQGGRRRRLNFGVSGHACQHRRQHLSHCRCRPSVN